MSNEVLMASLVKVIEGLNATGAHWGWPGTEIAGIAIRRWDTFSRRHPKTKHATIDQRVLDLAEGLQAHFEPDIPYTHPTDWRDLAESLSQALQSS